MQKKIIVSLCQATQNSSEFVLDFCLDLIDLHLRIVDVGIIIFLLFYRSLQSVYDNFRNVDYPVFLDDLKLLFLC